jgi:lipopolysaccharide export system permease protein
MKLLPFAVLLGGVFSFVRLSRSQELLAIRAAGVSAWNLLAPPLTVAGRAGRVHGRRVHAVFVAMLQCNIRRSRRNIFAARPRSSPSRATGCGCARATETAIRDPFAARREQGVRLEDVIVFFYGANDKFLGRIDAQSAADLRPGEWICTTPGSAIDGNPRASFASIASHHADAARIQESFASPDTLSFWTLPGFIATARQAGFSATRYQLYFDTLLVLPAMFAAMVFMAASFSLRLARLGGLGRVIVLSALAGFGVYFFGDVTQALGETGILPVVLAAAAPATAAILLGMTLVFHQEDG